jgi:hypothetical protein
MMLEMLGAIAILLTTVWSGTRFARWLRENERIKEDLLALKLECKECRAEVLDHYRDSSRHRDPERDEIRWDDLKGTLADMKQEIFRRLEGLESLIKMNGHSA